MLNTLQLPGFPSKFPCGEVFVKLDTDKIIGDTSLSPIVVIKKLITSSDDIMEILMLNDALHRAGIPFVSLQIPYVPYSRQDRVMTNGESLSIKVFADLINSCEFVSVEIQDPYSECCHW